MRFTFSALISFTLSVHGEFRFPPLVMPPPNNARTTGGRLSGDDMKMYMENFAGLFLKGMIRSQTEAIRLRRHQVSGSKSKDSSPWTLTVRDLRDESISELVYDKVVLCTGVSLFLQCPLVRKAYNLQGVQQSKYPRNVVTRSRKTVGLPWANNS